MKIEKSFWLVVDLDGTKKIFTSKPNKVYSHPRTIWKCDNPDGINLSEVLFSGLEFPDINFSDDPIEIKGKFDIIIPEKNIFNNVNYLINLVNFNIEHGIFIGKDDRCVRLICLRKISEKEFTIFRNYLNTQNLILSIKKYEKNFDTKTNLVEIEFQYPLLKTIPTI